MWFGSAVFYSAFVAPTLRTLGPEAGRLFAHLVRNQKAVIFFVTVSTMTVVAGGFLYWRDSAGLDIDWMQTGFGTGLTVGAIAGIISWLVVLLVLAPTSYRIVGLGERIAAAEAPPAADQETGIPKMQSRLNRFAWINNAFLAIAAIAMATARYLAF